jgi:hypothetical protein
MIAASLALSFSSCSANLDMAPSHAWPILLGALDEVTGRERDERLAQFRAVWGRGGIPRHAWLELAKKWNVCDGLEQSKGCRMPPGPLEAEGIAGEILSKYTNGQLRYVPSSPSSGS